MERIEQEFLHIINRGVDKRIVFQDSQDYARFIQNMYLFNRTSDPIRNITRSNKNKNVQHPMLNINDEYKLDKKVPLVKIHAWCLMPNHYHLLVTPLEEGNLALFMKRLNMGYSKYFNEKNKRVGALWQGKYKKIHIKTNSHFLYIPHYIHANPMDMSYPEWREQNIKNKKAAWDKLLDYKWSSLRDYVGIKNFPSIIYKDDLGEILGHPDSIKNTMLSLFSSQNNIIETLTNELE